MKYRFFAAIVLGVLVLNLGGSTFADTKVKKAASSQLVALLPESDAVVTFDAKRFFGEALPQVLANNQPILSKVTAHIEDIQTKLGIDVRRFDEMVVGVSAKQLGVKKYDLDPVVIARGQSTAVALIGAAKLASKSKYREERVGEKAMYIFDVRSVAGAQANATMVDQMPELAMASLDDRSIAFGD